jgi:hypothetical protein
MRMRDRGYVISCVQKALVRHSRDTVSGLGGIAKKLHLYGRSSVYNAARQPQHQELYANRIAMAAAILALAAVTARRRGAAVGAAAVAAMFASDAVRLMRLRGEWAPALAVPATSLEWVFDLGICHEALCRGQLRCLFSRFRYFDRSGFRRASDR